ncbi:Uncharacterised protein [Pseudomonas luteola]|uniref:Uncharacterized protein n=3 Tax=Pseudomonas TaxID=286 RepID=A0A2X2CY93_PSELU|nr:hypothetical protein SAMN05216409_11412 [Pseudomonas lutea]SPZ04895.1 Uncharacterised protein [Pseudomonas luteola]
MSMAMTSQQQVEYLIGQVNALVGQIKLAKNSKGELGRIQAAEQLGHLRGYLTSLEHGGLILQQDGGRLHAALDRYAHFLKGHA